jgi:two-component system alkaline phosphatase synthesis response regulator PhoP
MTKKILLVEDDSEIRELLKLHFNTQLYSLTSTATGKGALQEIKEGDFDLLILDITLPDMNGMELCKIFRQKNRQTPIMMLTCRGEESDKVLALELGADDYVTKPFGILELLARTKALLRRAGQAHAEKSDQNDSIIFKDLVIDVDKRKASVRGERMELTNKEFDLLILLAKNPGKTFSRHELLEFVWGVAFEGYEHTITSHINRLRIKIESNLQHPEYILTAWGTGYRFSE